LLGQKDVLCGTKRHVVVIVNFHFLIFCGADAWIIWIFMQSFVYLLIVAYVGVLPDTKHSAKSKQHPARTRIDAI